MALHRRLQRVVLSRLDANQADAEDGASYAIEVALEKGIDDFRYLASCALNYCRGQWNKRAIYGQMPTVEDDEGNEINADFNLITAPSQELTLTAIEAIDAIFELPTKSRRALTLLAQEYEPDEAASKLGVTMRNFESITRYGRGILKEKDFYQPRQKLKGHSVYRGVTKKHRKWVAKIDVNGKTLYLGMFTDAIDGARAYDEAAIKYLGERAKLNFPPANVC